MRISEAGNMEKAYICPRFWRMEKNVGIKKCAILIAWNLCRLWSLNCFFASTPGGVVGGKRLYIPIDYEKSNSVLLNIDAMKDLAMWDKHIMLRKTTGSGSFTSKAVTCLKAFAYSLPRIWQAEISSWPCLAMNHPPGLKLSSKHLWATSSLGTINTTPVSCEKDHDYWRSQSNSPMCEKLPVEK